MGVADGTVARSRVSGLNPRLLVDALVVSMWSRGRRWY